MTDYCLICETEPIDNIYWYKCEETTEMICPNCVADMRKVKELFK